MKVNERYFQEIILGKNKWVVFVKDGFKFGAFSDGSEIYHIMYVLLSVCR